MFVQRIKFSLKSKIHKTYVALTYGKISKSKDTLKDDLVYYDNNKKIIPCHF